MVFEDILRRELEFFETHRFFIYLPVKYVVRRLRGFFTWYLIAGFFAVDILISASIFCWIYASLTLITFSKIWSLFRLSVPKLMLCMVFIFLLGLLCGTLLRLALVILIF